MKEQYPMTEDKVWAWEVKQDILENGFSKQETAEFYDISIEDVNMLLDDNKEFAKRFTKQQDNNQGESKQ